VSAVLIRLANVYELHPSWANWAYHISLTAVKASHSAFSRRVKAIELCELGCETLMLVQFGCIGDVVASFARFRAEGSAVCLA
jgi:hypothetical protein